MRIRCSVVLLALGCGGALASASQTEPAPPTAPAPGPATPAPVAAPTPLPSPRAFVTRHTARFGSETVAYTASASEIFLKNDKGEPKAAIFSFAYVKDGVKDAATRPVIFLWNGGPGESSIWLHMGAMGPRRVAVPSDAKDDGPPPYLVEDNPTALLDATDLVFVDPVGAGWSRALGKHENKEFWGLNEDADAIADFIQAWVTQNKRWPSPKYLLGESFGTTRAAAVAARLEGGRASLSLNGLVLISQALDYTGSTPDADNVVACVTYLPTMAAAAWYHGKVKDKPPGLAAFLEEARAFALDEYAPALFKGSGLAPADRARVRQRLARFTGLSEEYVELSDLRIPAGRFLKELLRAEGKSLGRLDGRYVGKDMDRLSEQPDGDPAAYGIDGAYVASFNGHLQAELGVQMDRPYQFSGGRDLRAQWRWRSVPDSEPWEPSYVNTARDLSRALRRNSGLRVMVASGYYDFATPFFDAEYTFARHDILRERVTMTYYEAGHMMYLHRPSLDKLMADVRAFLRR